MKSRDLTKFKWLAGRYDTFKKLWYKFSSNTLSVIGLAMVIVVILLALFAPIIAPFPEDAGATVKFEESTQPPSLKHIFGTDQFGRDIFSRILFGYRFSLLLAIIVVAISTPPGVIMGLTAGYYRETKVDAILMRIVDIFMSVPALVLALSVAALLKPNIFNSMMAVTIVWWPWMSRLVYNVASSLQHEIFVQAAEVTGASPFRIIFREILPNCTSAIFTKMTLDLGYVIIIGSGLSFVGLGVQPPKPGLGTMVATGARYLPGVWWMAVFPALAIVVVVFGFNIVGDGLRDMLVIGEEEE